MSFNEKKNMVSTIVVTTVLDLVLCGTGRGAGAYKLDGSVVQPDVGKVVLDVIDQFGGGVMGTVVPDAEYGGICAMGVGLNEGMGCEESVGRIDY